MQGRHIYAQKKASARPVSPKCVHLGRAHDALSFGSFLHPQYRSLPPPLAFDGGNRSLWRRNTASPPRGEQRILSAIDVVFASRSMLYLTGRSRVFILFYMYRVHHAPQNDRWCYCSLSLDGSRQHFERLHGIVPGLIIVGVASFRQPLGTFFTNSFVDTAPSLRQSKTSSLLTGTAFSRRAR